ncbi:MAG: UbiA family prenyltransferase [Kiritimatiellaeota bacterium]|nr:UbiA family prenyltransferase [Kiritimatiellota bacterium]
MNENTQDRFHIGPWLELVRVPNLFTVPGDPWAGAMIAAAVAGRGPAGVALMLVGVASTLLYVFGLLLNDWVDRGQDGETRPERPLPRGAVEAQRVLTVAVASGALGLLFAALAGPAVFFVALVLCGLIVLYNLGLKASRLFGALGMGACRGSSLLLGAASVGISWPVWAAAAALATYIGAVTWLAFEEDGPRPTGMACRLPVGAMGFGFAIALSGLSGGRATPWMGIVGCLVFALGLAGVSAAAAALASAGAARDPERFRAAVGRLIRGLIPWQAAWVLAAANGGRGALLAALLLSGGLIARGLGRRWSGS